MSRLQLVSEADLYFDVYLNLINRTPMSPSNGANGPRLTKPEIAIQNRITDVEGNSVEQLLLFTERRSRKHCMVNCSDSSFHQDFCRRLSVEPRMATCSLCDEESSY